MKFSISLLFFIMAAGCQNSVHTKALDPASKAERLVEKLFNGQGIEKANAYEKLAVLGRNENAALQALIEEMNKPKYISSASHTDKLGDPKSKKRMWLAGLIESIAEEDFRTNTSAHGWNPDYSFDLINQWWAEKNKAKVEPVGPG